MDEPIAKRTRLSCRLADPRPRKVFDIFLSTKSCNLLDVEDLQSLANVSKQCYEVVKEEWNRRNCIVASPMVFSVEFYTDRSVRLGFDCIKSNCDPGYVDELLTLEGRVDDAMTYANLGYFNTRECHRALPVDTESARETLLRTGKLDVCDFLRPDDEYCTNGWSIERLKLSISLCKPKKVDKKYVTEQCESFFYELESNYEDEENYREETEVSIPGNLGVHDTTKCLLSKADPDTFQFSSVEFSFSYEESYHDGRQTTIQFQSLDGQGCILSFESWWYLV